MKIRILYTIPNFDTAGSGIPLLKIAQNLNREYFKPEIACLHGKGVLFQDVIKSGMKVHFIDLYKNARPISRMLWECFQLSKVFKRINPDIIHSYHYAADYTEPLAAKMAGIKWVYTKKNMSWKGPSFRGWKLRSWFADGIICQNTEMVRTFFPSWEKVKLIPIGVDVDEYKKQSGNTDIINQWGISENTRLVISVANLVPVKGIEILIGAFELLSNNHPNWKLIIVGDDTTEYGLKLKKNVSKKRHLKGKIIFTGKQKSVRDFLDISEIYVQPTLNKGRKEGAPISILEAMANGKIIIGSNISGICDQLEPFPEHLFKAGNLAELSNKMKRFMSNDRKTNKMLGEKFFDHVNNYYHLSNERKKLEYFYQKMISK